MDQQATIIIAATPMESPRYGATPWRPRDGSSVMLLSAETVQLKIEFELDNFVNIIIFSNYHQYL